MLFRSTDGRGIMAMVELGKNGATQRRKLGHGHIWRKQNNERAILPSLIYGNLEVLWRWSMQRGFVLKDFQALTIYPSHDLYLLLTNESLQGRIIVPACPDSQSLEELNLAMNASAVNHCIKLHSHSIWSNEG